MRGITDTHFLRHDVMKTDCGRKFAWMVVFDSCVDGLVYVVDLRDAI
jgi:hypothetical protein